MMLSCLLATTTQRRISTGRPVAALQQLPTTIMSDANSTATPVASNSSAKGVTFAPSPPRSSNGVGGGSGKNLMDSSSDAIMSKDELLMALKEVRSELAQARMDLSGEKAIRKRKEKNLVKLAKQLNTRSTTMDEQSQQLAALEIRYEATKKELDELTVRREKATRDHHAEITDQQTKQRALSRQHDARVDEMTAEYGRQTEELRRQVMESKLEQDKLRMKIAQLQMAAEPQNADRVVDQTLRESMATSTSSRSTPSSGGIMVLAAGLLLVPLLAYFASSGDSICAPCSPGTRLDGSSYAGEAPWWAPAPLKTPAFSMLCADRTRSRIEWTGGSGMSKLLVVDADAEVPASKQAVLVEKKAMRAVLTGEEIRATISASG